MKNKFNLLQAAKELLRNSGLSRSEKATLSALILHVDAEGKCFPKIKTIAEISGLSERQIHRALKKLKKVGVISVRRSRWNNVYQINFDWRPKEYQGEQETGAPRAPQGARREPFKEASRSDTSVISRFKNQSSRSDTSVTSRSDTSVISHSKYHLKNQISIVTKDELNSTEQASDAAIRKEKEKSKDLGEDLTQKPMTIPRPPSNEAAEFKEEKSTKDLKDPTQEPAAVSRPSEDKAAGLEDVGENVQESSVMPNSPPKGRQNKNAVEPKPEVNVAETGESVNPEKKEVGMDQKNVKDTDQPPPPAWKRESAAEKLLKTPIEQLKRKETPEELAAWEARRQEQIAKLKAQVEARKMAESSDKPSEEQSQCKESQATYNNPPSEQSKQDKHTQQPAKAANNAASPNAQRALAKAKTYGDVIDIMASEIAGAMRAQTMKTPTWEQWWGECLRRCVPENVARQAYQYYESNHWRDSKGRPIHNWRAIVNGLSRRQLEERAKRTEIKLRKEEVIHG